MTFEETKSNIEAVVITPLLAFREKTTPLNQIHNDNMHDFANVMSGLLTGSDGEAEFQGPGSMALANLLGGYLTTEQSITGSGTDFIGRLLEAALESEKIAHQLQQELTSIASQQDHTVESAGGLALGLDAGAVAQGGVDVPWDIVAAGASLVAAGLAATYNADQAKVQNAEMAKYVAVTEWSNKIEGIAAQPLPQLTPSPSKPNGDTTDFQKLIGLGVLATALKEGGTILQAHANDLPLDPNQVVPGGRIYIPPVKKGRGKPFPNPQGPGYVDDKGNIWEWARDQHGGEHWDVQHPRSKQHTNVAPDGSIIGGPSKDNFPNDDSLKK